ncbi:HNH endonuclease signature motif containing protein [soil metagenome]
MFEYELVDELSRITAAVASQPAALATPAQNRNTLRAIQASQDLLDATKAQHLAVLAETAAYQDDGSSTLATWVRNELRLDGREAKALVAAGRTMRALPLVGEAASSGEIRLEHVKRFTAGLRSVGPRFLGNAEPWLVDVAKTCAPGELGTVIRELRDAVHSDALDKKWAQGCDKEDIHLDPTPEGWHLTGFLSITTGAKFKAVLESVSVPRDKDDERVAAMRRMDGLDALLTGVLEHGLPADRGVRPQLGVMVEFDTALAQLAPTARTDIELTPTMKPAELIGFGAIGRNLLGYLSCGTDTTGYLTNGHTKAEIPQANILNVGRSHRLATVKQRQAVLARQHHRCAAPGCKNTHLEMHHVIWYSEGGPTDLDYLIGLCRKCHLLIHAKKLFVNTDGHGGFEFARNNQPHWQHHTQKALATTRGKHTLAA